MSEKLGQNFLTQSSSYDPETDLLKLPKKQFLLDSYRFGF